MRNNQIKSSLEIILIIFHNKCEQSFTKKGYVKFLTNVLVPKTNKDVQNKTFLELEFIFFFKRLFMSNGELQVVFDG